MVRSRLHLRQAREILISGPRHEPGKRGAKAEEEGKGLEACIACPAQWYV